MKIPQTSSVRSSCGPNVHVLRTHTGFITIKSSAARYFTCPEHEQHIPDGLLAPDNIPHFVYGHRTDVVD